MAAHRHILLPFLLSSLLLTQVYSLDNEVAIFKTVDNAAEKGAVCIDGTPAGYNYAPGFGDGVDNWGGGWCWKTTCVQRVGQWNGGTRGYGPVGFERSGMLSSNQSTNPGKLATFIYTLKIYVVYCDGSSFLGDTEALDNGTLVQLRGWKIFNAVMEELLEKGMKNAKNAILSGGSAGGLATILHCDDFQAFLPNTKRVKCLSDAGFFIRAKGLPYNDHTREWYYDATVKFHNLSNFLPTSCTSRMDASLCLFPEYLVGSIKTPLFILNSAFDFFQLHGTWPNPDNCDSCFKNISTCSPDIIQRTKEFGKVFHATLKEVGDSPSTGYLISSCYVHGTMDGDLWHSKGHGLENMTIAQAFADWYFDRSSVKLIDTHNDFVVTCQM